jgi:uncharacterized protein YhbP (UPF0306 family)
MSLATYNLKIWIASVYYAIDDEINFYFLSDEDTRHCQDIKKNSEVACAISDSSRDFSQTKIGIQIRGNAKKVRDLTSLKIAANLLIKIVPGFIKYVNPADINLLKSTDIYKIEPDIIKFFNKDLFPKNGYKIYKI